MQHERFPRGSRTERNSSSSTEDNSPKGTTNRKRNSLGAPSPTNHSSPEPFARSQSPRLNGSPIRNGDIAGTDVVSIDTLINEAKFARCRNRFVVPVILYQGKYICR